MRWIGVALALFACTKSAKPPVLSQEPIGLHQNPCTGHDRVSCFTKCNAGDRESCFRYALLEPGGRKMEALCSADLGKACYALGLVEKAQPLMEKDCDAGDGDACMRLAVLVAKDDDAVARFRLKGRMAYARSCRDGDATSCAFLGWTPDDPALAKEARERACALGDPIVTCVTSGSAEPRPY